MNQAETIRKAVTDLGMLQLQAEQDVTQEVLQIDLDAVVRNPASEMERLFVDAGLRLINKRSAEASRIGARLAKSV